MRKKRCYVFNLLHMSTRSVGRRLWVAVTHPKSLSCTSYISICWKKQLTYDDIVNLWPAFLTNWLLKESFFILVLTLSWRRLCHIETSPLSCSASQWTGFYIIGTPRHKRVKGTLMQIWKSPHIFNSYKNNTLQISHS